MARNARTIIADIENGQMTSPPYFYGQLVVWHHVIGAKSYDLRHFSHLAQRNADKLGGSGLVLQTPGLLHVFDWPDDANSIDRSGFAAYTPLQLINR